MKRLLYVFLSVSLLIILSSCDTTDLVGNNRRELSKEETMFTLGRYPQSLVKDESVYIDVLKTIDESEWEDLTTFAATSYDGEAQYIDIDQDNDGLRDYRLVQIIKNKEGYGSVESPYEGYYLFNWEPVKWNIIRREGEIDNKKEAYAFSDIVLDTTFFDTNGKKEYAISDLRKIVVGEMGLQIFTKDELNSLKGNSYEDTIKNASYDNPSYENDCIQIANINMTNGHRSSEDGSMYYNGKFYNSKVTDYSKVMGNWGSDHWTNEINDSGYIVLGRDSILGSGTKDPASYHGVLLVIIVDYDKYRPEGY
ncbi:MAG: hypothetical protein IJS83_02370 [Acholeplasmatales bacterium]|nr:hypothetical protein [Acholeplasmatales bacterium]